MTALTHTKIVDRIRELERGPRKESEQRDCEEFRVAKEAMKALGKSINGGSPDIVALGLLTGLWQEHRYLQNNLIQILITVLGNLSEVEGTDARNEFGIGLCQEVRVLLKDKLFWKDLA